MGVVGLRFGQHIVDAHLVEGQGRRYFELGGVCDLDEQKARAVSARHGVPIYPSFHAMLNDPAIQVVGLFTPPHGRAELVRQAIRAGKHVLTTKPFEMDPHAALSVLQEAKRLGRAVHMNSPAPLCPPELAQILRWRDQYDLGAAVACQAETWASYHEQDDGSWYCDPLKCPAAPILRLGIYCINDLVRLFGPAESVQVMRRRVRTGRPTADNAQLQIGFRNGAIGGVFASFCIDDGNPYPCAKRVSYERGTIYCNFGPPDAEAGRLHLQLVMAREQHACVVERAAIERDRGSSTYQWQALYRAARGETLEGQITPQQVAAGVAILAAMARADQSGACEPVPAVETMVEAVGETMVETGGETASEGAEAAPRQPRQGEPPRRAAVTPV